jgi:hypothetical protein
MVYDSVQAVATAIIAFAVEYRLSIAAATSLSGPAIAALKRPDRRR